MKYDPALLPSRPGRAAFYLRDFSKMAFGYLTQAPGYLTATLVDAYLTPADKRLPTKIEELADPAVLSRFSERKVESVEMAEGREQHANSTDRAWFDVRYEGDKDVTPLFAKVQASESTVSFMMGMMGLYRNEVRAYESIEFPVLRPKAHMVQQTRSRFVLILEDLASQGATFPNIWSTEVDLDLGKRVLRTLASLHAKFWGTKVPPGIWSMSSGPYYSGAAGLILLDRARRRCGPTLFDNNVYETVRAALFHWPALLDHYAASQPKTLCHGDTHMGNFYIADDGEVGVIDLQVLVEEHPMRDVTYFLMTSYPQNALAHDESELITYYLECLAEFGVPAADVPSFDEAWESYRIWSWFALYTFVTGAGIANVVDAYQSEIAIGRIVAAMERVDAAGAFNDLIS